MRIGVFIFDGVEELDFVGPFEVFTMSNEVFARAGETPPDEVLLVAEHDRPVVGAKGMRVLPDRTIAETGALDILLVPGGIGTRALLNNRGVLDWIAETGRAAQWTTSVCTGSFLLAASGAATGRRVTTHWAAMDEMRGHGWPVEIVEGERYVADGNVVAAAGVSAGIDMALWLFGQIHGPDHARATQRAMEYDPNPPYADEKPSGS